LNWANHWINQFGRAFNRALFLFLGKIQNWSLANFRIPSELGQFYKIALHSKNQKAPLSRKNIGREISQFFLEKIPLEHTQ
jgi:hypothetical protein